MGVWNEGRLTDGGGQAVSGQYHHGPVSPNIIQVLNCSFSGLHIIGAEGKWKTNQRMKGKEKQMVFMEKKEEDLRAGERRVENKWQMKRKGQTEGERNDVPASSGVFGLLLAAYHGNDCLDPAHLGSTPKGLRIIKVRRLGRMEKERKRRWENQGTEGGWWRLQMMSQLVWCYSQTVPYSDSNKPNWLLVALLSKMDD